MFSHRTSTLFIAAFWAVSMSWLGWAKLRPAVNQNEPPQNRDVLPADAVELAPVRWRITVNNSEIGWAMHQVKREEDGQGMVESTVRIDQLTLDQLLQQGFGRLGSLFTRGLGDGSAEFGMLQMTIENAMHFDHFGELEHFACSVREDAWGELIQLNGTVREGELFLRAYLVMDDSQGQTQTEPVYQKVLALPPDKLVIDSLSPRPRFGQLRVGQHWQFESYNPLMPTRPLQTLDATVEERRALRYGGREVMTLRVVYRALDDGGLSLDDELGEVWVTEDGTVLRQTFRWGQMVLEFDRLPDSESASAANERSRGASR